MAAKLENERALRSRMGSPSTAILTKDISPSPDLNSSNITLYFPETNTSLFKVLLNSFFY